MNADAPHTFTDSGFSSAQLCAELRETLRLNVFIVPRFKIFIFLIFTSHQSLFTSYAFLLLLILSTGIVKSWSKWR